MVHYHPLSTIHNIDKILLMSVPLVPKSVRKVIDKRFLVAVGDTNKTGPLVHDQADDAYCEGQRNDDDYD